MRPRTVVAVLGTGTEVGKTFVGAAIAVELRGRGHSVIARKPAQSYEDRDVTTDAQELGRATDETPHTVCPPHRWYPVPMAPPMAATALGRPSFTIDDLATETRSSWPDEQVDLALVETAGGAWSPQSSDGRHAGDFVEAVGADAVLLVADAGLGVINAVRGASAALEGLQAVIVFLNRFDATDVLHVRNLAWLQQRDGVTVVTAIAEAATALLAL